MPRPEHLALCLATLTACGPTTGQSGDSGEPDASSESGASDTGEPSTTAASPTTTGDEPSDTSDTTDTSTGAELPPGNPGVCDVVQGEHTAACRAPDCALVVDLEIRCPDDDFASRGMGVAPAPDTTWFVHGSYYGALLLRADADGVALIDGVVDDVKDETILMTQGPDGAPHIAFDATPGPNPDGGLHHVALIDGAWTDTLFSDSDRSGSPLDVKVDSQGRPHVFFYDGNNASGWSSAVRDGGAWTSHIIASPGSWTHFVLGPDDDEIVLATLEDQLTAFVGDQTIALGSPLPKFSVRYQAATAAVGPALAVALQLGDQLEVAWSPGPGALKISGTAALGNGCPYIDVDGPEDLCEGLCHDDAVGMLPDAFSFTRTADGVGWLAWVVTNSDRDGHYSLSELEGAYFCGPAIDRDDTTSVFHLARVPLGAGAPSEVLTFPLANLAAGLYDDGYPTRRSPVVLEAFDKDLAIALRVLGEQTPPKPYARLLRVDTSKLP